MSNWGYLWELCHEEDTEGVTASTQVMFILEFSGGSWERGEEERSKIYLSKDL